MNKETHVVFIYLALIFGLIFIFLTPPFQSPDEDSHFKKAYLISKGQIIKSSDNIIDGYYLPQDMIKYSYEKTSKMSNRNWKYTYSDFYNDNFMTVEYSNEILSDFSAEDVSIIPYIPASVGIFIARHTSNMLISGMPSTAYMLYFARFFNLIAYVILGALAIKITPILKKTMMTVLLLPMSLFLGSMMSYDSILISISLLTIALILDMIYNKKTNFDTKHLIIFAILGFVLLKLKVIYFIIIGLLLMVPKNKFKDNKKIKYALYTIGLVILLYLISKIPYLFNQTVVSNGSELITKQKEFAFNNPFLFVGNIFKNIYAQKSMLLIQMIGVLGLLDTYLPRLIIFILVLLIGLVSLSELSLDKIKIDTKTKVLSLLIFIVLLIAIYAAMYLMWTPLVLEVGGNTITGVQGRYLLPIIILPLFILSNNKLKKYKMAEKIMNIILEHYTLIIFIGLMVSSLMLLIRYWC